MGQESPQVVNRRHCAINCTDLLLMALTSRILRRQVEVVTTSSKRSTHSLLQVASMACKDSLQP